MSERNNEVPVIPKHQHQAEMMHMGRTVRMLVIGIIVGFLCMVGMAYIFVSGYTSRTKDILNTINNLKIYTVEESYNGQKEP